MLLPFQEGQTTLLPFLLFSFTIRVILHEVMGEGPNAFHD